MPRYQEKVEQVSVTAIVVLEISAGIQKKIKELLLIARDQHTQR